MGRRGRGNRHGSGSFVPSGFERIREAGDGDCLFHAIARQTLGDPRLAYQVRKDICDWMQTNLPLPAGRSPLTEEHRRMIAAQREELLSYSSNDEARIQQYVRKMRRSGEWGSGLEALCAAYRYGRSVHVWSPSGFSELCPPLSILSAQNRQLDSIILLNNGHNHWDSLLDVCAVSTSSANKLRNREDDVVPLFPPSDDEENLRRALAASAAEERQRRVVAALCRLGLSLDESTAIIVQSNFDIDRVQQLYGIDLGP